MSKFKEPTLPLDPAKAMTVVTVPCSAEMSLDQRKAELETFSRVAGDELMLRMRYHMLLRTLDQVEAMEPVPDDWRAKLSGRKAAADDGLKTGDTKSDGLEDDGLDREDDDLDL